MSRKSSILGVIPARYQSSRFPGKPLAMINEKPMIQWVYEACKGIFDDLLVATDDERISAAVEGFGGNALLTSETHFSGTERCLEALEIMESKGKLFEYVVNIQGDEPLIQHNQLLELVACLKTENAEIATLVKALSPEDEPENPNIVKVVLNEYRHAMYFSRSPIPYYRNDTPEKPNAYLKHIGLYGYRSSVLRKIAKLSASKLEQAESLEQLRWLENGFRIHTALTTFQSIGIDTPEDLERLKALIKE